jgi:PKD repeat protein
MTITPVRLSRCLRLIAGIAVLGIACDENGPSNVAPTATFTAQCTALGCSFTNGSTDSDGTVEAYEWDFGDESATSATRDATHTYAVPGSFTVTLTVTDDDGDAATATAAVSPTAPVNPGGGLTANFTVSCVFLACEFTDRSTAGSFASFTWTFGDNSEAVTTRDASHTYTAEGQFEVTLHIVEGAQVATASETITVEVLNPPPGANFIYACTDLACEFIDRSTDEVGGVAGYSWDFGDGTTSIDQSPSHTFPGAGTYLVEQTVTDARGAGATVSVTFTLPAIDWPTAELEIHCSYSQCAFWTVSTGGSVVAWHWSFGDGATSTDQSPSHTYAADGTYTVQATITGATGSTSTLTQEVTVPALPGAAFSVSCDGVTCTFENESVDFIFGAFWEFGDGSTSEDWEPSHVYQVTETTTFTVRLTAYDFDSNPDVTTREVTVSP